MRKRKNVKSFRIDYPHLYEEWDFELNKNFDPEQISAGSTLKINWICKKNPKHKWAATINNRAYHNRGCPYCKGTRVLPEESFAILHAELMEEWHPTENAHLDPYTISIGSGRKVVWVCKNNSTHIWKASIVSRARRNTGCPYCANQKVDDTNSLLAKFPEVAKEWHPTKNGNKSPDKYASMSNESVWWLCKDCMYEWQAQIRNRTLLNSGCPLCSRDKGIVEYKKNLYFSEEEIESDYSYETEERLFLQEKQIQNIFKNQLKIEPWDKTIETLLGPRVKDKIDYEPYYQRKYVWDNTKATYFIESILIGTEIPPLIVFESKNRYEIIDGKQRFETILKFFDNDFSLTSKGLYFLKFLDKLYYSDLETKQKELLLDTRIRIIKFSLINETRMPEKTVDMLKKEIFRRYNSGITPLRRVEIEKAIYITDEPTKFFKRHLKKNINLFSTLVSLFLAESDREKLDKEVTLEKLLQEIRFLLVASEIPITSSRRKELLDEFYDRFSEEIKDTFGLYKNFIEKIKFLETIKEFAAKSGLILSRYAFESLYWGLSVLEKEKINLTEILEDTFLVKLNSFFKSQSESYIDDARQFMYSQFMRRYNGIAELFGNHFNVSFSIYLSSNQNFREQLKEIRAKEDEQEFITFESIRIEKPEPISFTIDEICRLMIRGKFLVRPPYQRGEVINKLKSSAIIESILLGIKLPPLFIFQRTDGVYEVIDGQQRLLSILGYIDREFLDENGNKVKSEKSGYALTKLKILEDPEIEGKTFNELSEVNKDVIYDFSLSFILIDQKLNPNFDPVDLFIRLNNRPYPIKENSFEMWNSYIEKEIIDAVKEITDKYENWFYVLKKENNKRMRNEELITILSFLEYQAEFSDFDGKLFYPFLDVYHKEDALYVRVKNKTEVTKLLNKATLELEERKKLLKSIKRVESFIKRLKTILVDRNVSNETEFLDKELTGIFNISDKKYYKRTLQDYYALWFILHFLSQEIVNQKREEIKNKLKDIFIYIKTVASPSESPNERNIYLSKINDFRKTYSVVSRKINLTKEEKEELIKYQNSTCPICGGSLFISDEIEVDHIVPISKGGRDRFLNLQITHKNCNRKKGSKIIN